MFYLSVDNAETLWLYSNMAVWDWSRVSDSQSRSVEEGYSMDIVFLISSNVQDTYVILIIILFWFWL